MSSTPVRSLPPFCQVTPNDHGGWVAVATGVGLCCALVALMIRVFVRVVISPPFGHDDTAILLATVLSTIQSSVVLYGVSKGLGRAVDLISPAELQAVEKLLRWQIVIVFDVLTEVLIFAMSYYLVHDLLMASKNKFIVVGAFGTRLIVVPVLIIRLISFPRHDLSSNPAFTLTYFYIWTQTTLYISIMTSIIPCLKPFVAGLNTGYGAFDTEHVSTNVYGRYGSHGYAPRNIHTKHSSRLPSKPASFLATKRNVPVGDGIGKKQATLNGEAGSPTSGHYSRPSTIAPAPKEMGTDLNPSRAGQDKERGEGKTMTQTWPLAQDGNSIESNDSQRMIIRKDITWRVDYSSRDN